jgi:hypothetical protein
VTWCFDVTKTWLKRLSVFWLVAITPLYGIVPLGYLLGVYGRGKYVAVALMNIALSPYHGWAEEREHLVAPITERELWMVTCGAFLGAFFAVAYLLRSRSLSRLAPTIQEKT